MILERVDGQRDIVHIYRYILTVPNRIHPRESAWRL